MRQSEAKAWSLAKVHSASKGSKFLMPSSSQTSDLNM